MVKIVVIYRYLVKAFLLFFSQKETSLVKKEGLKDYDLGVKFFFQQYFSKEIALSVAIFYYHNPDFIFRVQEQKNIDIFLPEKRFKIAFLKINNKKLFFKKVSDFYNFLFFLKANASSQEIKLLDKKFVFVGFTEIKLLDKKFYFVGFTEISKLYNFYQNLNYSKLIIFLNTEEFFIFKNYIRFLIKKIKIDKLFNSYQVNIYYSDLLDYLKFFR